jgi:3-deoxy-D-manno-octulosonic-acid transferase
MSNFVEVMQQLIAEKGIVQLGDKDNSDGRNIADELFHEINAILMSEETQQALGESAHRVVTENQGASQRTLKQLLKLI